jgi:hypothetical protein
MAWTADLRQMLTDECDRTVRHRTNCPTGLPPSFVGNEEVIEMGDCVTDIFGLRGLLPTVLDWSEQRLHSPVFLALRCCSAA